MNNPTSPTYCRALILITFAALLGGCETYHLRGMVVEGNEAGVLIVDPIDSRIKQHSPLPGADVKLTIDPNTMSPKVIGDFKTDETGSFTTSIDQLGAGFLQYDLGVLTSADVHRTHWQIVKLPPRDKVLLIIIEAGRDNYKHPEDLLNETKRLGEQLMR